MMGILPVFLSLYYLGPKRIYRYLHVYFMYYIHICIVYMYITYIYIYINDVVWYLYHDKSMDIKNEARTGASTYIVYVRYGP